MTNLLLKNCKIIPENTIVDIQIEDNKIIKISKTTPKTLQADKVIDLKEKIVLPGLIDTHVHFRDPGQTYKESWKTGSQSAAHGGYTTVIDMPNTTPNTNTAKRFKEKQEIANKKSIIDYGLHAGINTSKDIKELSKLKPASFKIFMDLYTDDKLKELFKIISDTGKILTLHCEDKEIIEHSTKKQKEVQNAKPIAYTKARPALAEIISIEKAIQFAKENKQQLHICHVSTRKSVELIKIAQKQIKITMEVTPHHLFLDSTSYNTFKTKAKTNPPLRSLSDNIKLEQLNEFNSIATDHAPHTIEEKTEGTWNSAAGIPGLETTLPLLLTEVNKGNIKLDLIQEKLCENPAKIFNIPNKGFIKEGYDADLIVLNMKLEGKINSDNFYTKGKYTPFEKRNYKGDSILTIQKGNIIVENNEVYKNKGNYIY
ncbi:MAG: dihydroorotase family protein [Methanobacteriaceae archaeon]|nr:dihydroorotase family protein [Methanobacteriaceae archaeon]